MREARSAVLAFGDCELLEFGDVAMRGASPTARTVATETIINARARNRLVRAVMAASAE
jgi:hypothetical protein